MSVRDLSTLLGNQSTAKKLESSKEFKNELKLEKLEKLEHKEKPEKFEHKEKPEKHEHKEKPEKWEHKEKPEKFEIKEKPEKHEHKEKPEKIEHKEKFEHKDFIKSELGKLEIGEPGKPGGAEVPGPGPVETGGDPRVDQLVQSVSQLQQDVANVRENVGGQ
jgi:FKBP-type peptidyl-prolyl cis-trans isomerase